MSVSFTRPLARKKRLRARSPARKIRAFRLTCRAGPVNSAAINFVFGKGFRVQSESQLIVGRFFCAQPEAVGLEEGQAQTDSSCPPR